MNLQSLDSLFGVPIPSSILALWRKGVENLEAGSPGSGYSIGYGCRDLELTVIIYGDLNETSPDYDSVEHWVKEFNLCHSTLTQYFKSCEKEALLVRRKITGSGNGVHEFLSATFLVKDNISPFFTRVDLAKFQNKFVKLRLSTRDVTESDSLMMDLTCQEFARILWPNRGVPWEINVPNAN